LSKELKKRENELNMLARKIIIPMWTTIKIACKKDNHHDGRDSCNGGTSIWRQMTTLCYWLTLHNLKP
jgi:hypothetical protein